MILDVDTGLDDAYALMFAARCPGIDLLGVTCVAGNVDVSQVVRNTLDVLDMSGSAEVPVASGATGPLVDDHRSADHYHGENGVGGVQLPAPHDSQSKNLLPIFFTVYFLSHRARSLSSLWHH